MTVLCGTWFVLPTAFSPDGSLDLESQRRVVEAALAWKVDGLTVLGVMGEASSLSPKERGEVLKTVISEAGGRVPIAVGCSGGSNHLVISNIQEARALGADAAMVSAPPLVRDGDQLPTFFRHVASQGELPLIIQDDPASTGVSIPLSILRECLVSSGSTTVKLEDPPTAQKIAKLVFLDGELKVFGGLGGLYALAELRRGACGTMTGFAFPEILREVRIATECGEHERARKVFNKFLPLIAFEAQPGISLSIRKELLRVRGALASAITRGPIARVDTTISEELDEVLESVGVKPSVTPLTVD